MDGLTAADNESTSASSLRPAFSDLHLLQAQSSGGITEAHRAARPRVPTHPIDNIEAHVVSDRDDGIFVETHRRDGGGYRVYITIADVAGHIPLRNILAQTAIARGFTVYGSGWTDPMFPKTTEEKFSLEHRQERLGFTIAIDLDTHFTPRHTEFMPVITHAESMSYAQAAERMETDPQLHQMALIAAGVRKHYFHSGQDTKLLQDVFSGRDLYVSSSSSWRSATDMVATYMLLANHCVANFFDKSTLPYLYRNFDSSEEDAHASYHTRSAGHDALQQDIGLRGAYGHFTSPIRRAADLLNSYMAHFAFDALQATENVLMEYAPRTARSTVHTTLWKHGAEIMRLCAPETDRQKQQQYQSHAQDILTDLLHEKIGLKKAPSQQVAATVITRLQQLTPPLSFNELEHYAAHLNALAHTPEMRTLNKKSEDYRKLENLDKNSLPEMEKRAFSALLRHAATSGEIPRPLYNEALARITSGQHDNTRDGFSILVLAIYPDIPRWNTLKRAILRRIKHDPSAVNAIIGQCQSFSEESSLQESSMSLPDHYNAFPSDYDTTTVFAAILSLKQKDSSVSVAAPFYSVGHNLRAASSHARYAFLEYYAFGELQPVEQIAIPNILYADLESGEQSRRELVKEMAAQVGGKLKIRRQEASQGIRIELEISGGKFILPVVVEAEKATEEAAEQAAFQYLLRDRRFKHTVAPTLQIGPIILNPQDMLRRLAQEKGYTLTFSTTAEPTEEGFQTTITLTSGDITRTYKKPGPNKDRALRAATIAALKGLGITLENDYDGGQDAQSWVTDNDKERDDRHTLARKGQRLKLTEPTGPC